MSPALAGGFFITELPGSPRVVRRHHAFIFGFGRQPHQNTTRQPSTHDRATPVTARHSQRFSFTLTSLHHLTMSAMPSPLNSPTPCSPSSDTMVSDFLFLSLAAPSYYCNLHLHSPYECHKIHSQTASLEETETQEAKIFSQWLSYFMVELEFESRSLNLCPWKQPRCPSADEWIRKLWYIYTMEYYSAIKKNTFESVLMRGMKLEPIIQSEVSQKEKHQYSILTHIYGI